MSLQHPRLEFITDCVHSTAKFVDAQMNKAHEISKHGKWANILIAQSEWDDFAVKKDWHTRLYKNDRYLIFQHSAIEYFYRIS